MEQLKALAAQGTDGENLVSFYDGYSNDTIDESVYVGHLRKLNDAFTMLEQRFDDGRPFITGQSLTMADVIWAMKCLRLEECGYPFETYYPAVLAWYQRMRSRPAFQSGVMGKHKFFNTAFRFKARVETLFGIGLVEAMNRHVHA